MIDIKYIESIGGTRKALRPIFETPKPGKKIRELLDLSESRLRDGMNKCLRDARIFDAIDAAMDVCKRQITFTFVADLIAKGQSGEQVMMACKEWGYTRDLDCMMVDCLDDNGNVVKNADGSNRKKLDLPTFFHVFVPLAFGYISLRSSKLFNDRHQYPFLTYSPIKQTGLERARAKLLTARAQRMVSEMGYVSDVRQGIYRTLKHGRCIWLPREPYYTEYQYPGGKKEVEREGIRWEQFHPSRCFFDDTYRLSSLNTDTGSQFVGGWSVRRWSEVSSDKTLWNRDRVSRQYPSEVVSALRSYRIGRECIIDFPMPTTTGMKDDRQENAFYLPTDSADQPVIQAPLFQKIVPKEWGLYPYKGPVWHRFLFGGWGTVMSVDPWAYAPPIAFEGDGDQDMSVPTSLALQIVPFQDHLTNLLVQYILAVKGNLERLVLLNADYVDKPILQKLTNVGYQWYGATRYVPYSERELSATGVQPSQLFTNIQREPQNVSEIATLINNLLAMMERILGFSAQELGQAAAHAQTSTEVRIVATNSGERLRTTGACIDEGIWALKDRVYRAIMAYGSDEVWAEVADLTLDDIKELEDLGYEVGDPDPQTGRRGVTGKKANMELDGWASRRDGEDLVRDQDIANAMVSVFQAVASNQVLVDRVGPDVVVDLFNQILRYAGVPDDYRLNIARATGKKLTTPGKPGDPAVDQEAQQPSVTPADMQAAMQMIGQKLQEITQGSQQNDAKLVEAIAQFRQEVTAVVQNLSTKDAQHEQAIMQSLQRLKLLSDNVAAIGQAITGQQAAPAPPMPGA